MVSPLSLKIAPCTHVTREQKPQQELLRAQPTQLLLLLQQDEAERRVPQDELPGCGQAHDAAAHHGHVIGAARGEVRQATDSSDDELLITNRRRVAQNAEISAGHSGQWFNVQLFKQRMDL